MDNIQPYISMPIQPDTVWIVSSRVWSIDKIQMPVAGRDGWMPGKTDAWTHILLVKYVSQIVFIHFFNMNIPSKYNKGKIRKGYWRNLFMCAKKITWFHWGSHCIWSLTRQVYTRPLDRRHMRHPASQHQGPCIFSCSRNVDLRS